MRTRTTVTPDLRHRAPQQTAQSRERCPPACYTASASTNNLLRSERSSSSLAADHLADVGRCWTRPGTRCLTRCSGRSVASGCRKRLTRNAQRASRHEAYLPRRRRGKAWLVVIARSLRTEDATACTPSRWMWINTSTHAGAAWRRVLLAQPVSYTHLRAHETGRNLVCRLLLEKKK